MTVAQQTLRRKPTLAGLMSIFPGLGQLYNGQVYKAVLFALVALLPIAFLCLVLILHAPFPPPYNVAVPVVILLAVRIAIITDAFVTAKRLGENYEPKRFNKSYVYVAFVLALSFYEKPARATEARPYDNLGPLTVPAGSYFVMGDNRDQSLDSRFWGYVKLEKIKGKASVIYWSWEKNSEVRWKRIGKKI